MSPIIKGVISPVKIACTGTSQAKYEEFSAIVEKFNSAFDEFVKGKDYITKKELKNLYKELFPGVKVKIHNKKGIADGAVARTLPCKKSIQFAYPFQKNKLPLNTGCDLSQTGTIGKEVIKHETNHMIFFSTIKKPTFINEISKAFKLRKNNILFKPAFKNQSLTLYGNFYRNKIYSDNIIELSKAEVLKMRGFVKDLNQYISKNSESGKNAEELTQDFFKLNRITREKPFSKKAFKQDLKNFFKVNNIPNYEKNIYLKNFYKSLEAEKFAFENQALRNSKNKDKSLETLEQFLAFDKKLKVLRGERARAIINERRMLHNGGTQPVESFLETFKPLISGTAFFS